MNRKPPDGKELGGLTISIDYDNTFTSIPNELNIFVNILKLQGHTVIVTTCRNQWTDDMLWVPVPPDVPIIYAGGDFKQKAAEKAGYKVDIWIDDHPGTIQPQVFLNDNL